MKKEHKDVILEYIKDNPGVTRTSLADMILDDDAITGKSHRTLRRYIGQVMNQLEDDIIEEQATSSDTILVDPKEKEADAVVEIEGIGTVYRMMYNKEVVDATEDVVNWLFCAYSRKGLNYNKPQILATLKIDRKVFDALVSHYGLSKESEPLGPHYIDAHTPEEIADKTAEVTGELLDIFSESDSTVVEAVVREYKKKITSLVLDSKKEEEMFATLIDHLPKLKIKRLRVGEPKIKYPRPTLYVVIGDMHIGLETDDFSVEKARAALAYMAYVVDKEYASEAYNGISVISLGDVMHTVSGINHANMWKDLEPGLWGAQAIIKPYELLAEFIYSLPDVKYVYGVGGNHDRQSDRKDLEPTDEGGRLVFYMLDNTFDDVNVVWDPDKVIWNDGRLTFIILHGDQGQDKRSGQDIAWNLGNPANYNLILVGHTHTRQIAKNDDGIGFRKMVCPAFCPTDSYAERLGYNSLPGFLLIKEDDTGYPVVMDFPLNYKEY